MLKKFLRKIIKIRFIDRNEFLATEHTKTDEIIIPRTNAKIIAEAMEKERLIKNLQ